MNFRLSLKIVGLSALAILAAGSLGCGMFRPKSVKPEEAGAVGAKEIAVASALRPNDSVVIRLDTAAGREEHVKTVDEDGSIELPFVGKIKLSGLTVTQAQEVVRKLYVPRYYSYMTVTVMLQTQRMIYLSGETRGGQGGGMPYRDDLTVYRAIQASGGFSEFAKKREVVLTRNGKQMIVDCVEIEKHPELDIPLLPGDILMVPKSNF